MNGSKIERNNYDTLNVDMNVFQIQSAFDSGEISPNQKAGNNNTYTKTEIIHL